MIELGGCVGETLISWSDSNDVTSAQWQSLYQAYIGFILVKEVSVICIFFYKDTRFSLAFAADTFSLPCSGNQPYLYPCN